MGFGRCTLRRRSLRSLLTLLIGIPLSLCVVLAGITISERVESAHSAGVVAAKVDAATDLQVLQSDLSGEIVPAMSLQVFASPVFVAILGLGRTRPSDVGLSHGVVEALRAVTDADLHRLADDTGQRAVAGRTATAIDALRRRIDHGLPDAAVFATARGLAAALTARAQTLLGNAISSDTEGSVTQALRDSALVGAATTAAADELAWLVTYKFPSLAAGTSQPQARASWLAAWSRYRNASLAVTSSTSRPTASSWRSAAGTKPVAMLDTTMQAFAVDPDRTMSIPDVVMLYQGDSVRAGALVGVTRRVAQRAVDATHASAATSARSAQLLGGSVGLALLASVALAVAVRRSIARPLQALSQQAAQVSRGDLVDVAVDGPREVRTVAAGLSAAVDNLRRIEAQAAAVATGDLTGDIVREPLPGRLGAVMHESVTTIIGAIHDRDAAQQDLAYQATHDVLTGLPNRAQAMVSIEHALARSRRTDQPIALMFVDLDHFKAVNDTFGHAAGDAVLQVCARRMRAALRTSDMVFRFGGDEFVVLLEDLTPDFPFVDVAEDVIRSVSAPIGIGELELQVGACVGVSVSRPDTAGADQLLVEADTAAYRAKAAGRGGVGVFDDALRETLESRAALESEIDRALLREEFVLHYQPVVEMTGRRPVGFEALIRWNHPTRGLTPPSEFVDIAEKSSLINRIGRWTLHEATAQLARWSAAGSCDRLTMAVNISGRHLVTPALIEDVRSALDASGVDASRLIVEVTETVLVDDPIALANLAQLRALGVAIAIDDFGTGYTSIGQLSNLPIDVVKIDRSFVGSDGPAHRSLVRLITEASHAFGLRVVAEGIETPEQADEIGALSVDSGQGYYFARPADAVTAARLGGSPLLPAEGR